MRRVILRYCALAAILLCGGVRADPPTIAIDVGHTSRDRGASSARGRSEFDFNLELASRLAAAVRERGLAVKPVNFGGDIGSLIERPRQAAGSDLLISIHHDSIEEKFLQVWQWDGAEQTYTDVKRGFGLFVSRENPGLAGSLRCASAIGERLRAEGFAPTDWHRRKHAPADAANGVWYFDNLVVLRHADMPAVLLEAGVIKHRDEELALRDPQRQGRMADAVAAALARCLAGQSGNER